jgi:hypothetical protein
VFYAIKVKKFNSWLKERKSVITRLAILVFLLAALPLTLYLNSKNQDTRQRASTPDNTLVCTFDTWKPVPDWSKGNNSLGNGYYCGPENPENRARCAAYFPGIYDDGGDGGGKWMPGPAMPAGTILGVGGTAPNFSTSFGGKLPVTYDSNNDRIGFEYSGKLGESAWSSFVRRMDDSYFINYTADMANHTIATGVLMKYEILRIARGAFYAVVHDNGKQGDPQATDLQKELEAFMKQENGLAGGQTFTAAAHYKTADGTDTNGKTVTRALLSQLMGFDVTNLDIASWGSLNSSGQWDASNETVRKAHMIDETKACGSAIPTPIPTSTTPVSCTTHLKVPAADYVVNIPAFTPNICPAAKADDPKTGKRMAEELFNCGDYWVTNWCNASSDTMRQDVVYACRGWSQTGDGLPNGVNSFYRYFPNRISTVTTSKGTNGPGSALQSNIAKYGDVEGRRKTWNDLMDEVKSGAIAFPYGYKNMSGALQAAAAAIFDKPWGAVVEQERLNNCSITGAPTVTPETSITPVVTPTTNDEQPITNDGDQTKDLNPKVVKDGQNNVYVTWDKDKIVHYSKGTWNGSNYTFSTPTPIGGACASQGCKPGIAVNEAGTKVMIAWGADPNLSIFTWDGTPGISTGTSTPMKYPMGFGLEPNIAVDSQGVFHLVANGDNKTKYCKYDIASGTCSVTKEFTETFSHPEIAIDSTDNIHIVSSGNGKINYYTKPLSGNDFTTKQLDNGGNGQQITADKQGNVYITWSKDFNIQICKKTITTDCSANNTQTVTDGQATNPSVGVTSNGDVLVAYASSNQVLKYVTYTGGSWSHPASFGLQGSVAVDVSPLSYDNKLSAVWSQNWDIWHKFFTFDEGTRVKVTLGLDGIGSAGDYANTQANDKSNKNPKTRTRPLALQFYDEQNNLMFTKIGNVTYDQQSGDFTGNISVGNDLAEGTKFFIKAKMDQYLLKNLPGFIFKLNDQNTFVRNTLTTGDINGDNKLSVLDYNVLSDCYSDINTTPHACSDTNKKLSDLNDDGSVNQIDYNLFVRELPKGQGD